MLLLGKSKISFHITQLYITLSPNDYNPISCFDLYRADKYLDESKFVQLNNNKTDIIVFGTKDSKDTIVHIRGLKLRNYVSNYEITKY